MWVVKTKGTTYYVSHINCTVGWSTKETPDNPHTKGSIKLKNVDVNINNSEATISATLV
jgi:hypothetical protein